MKNLFFQLLLSALALGTSVVVFGQYHINENKVWVFGERAGLDFNGSTPQAIRTAITNVGGNALYESSASVCDQFGRLLFYTNGERVWDRHHAVMPNGNQLPPASPLSMVSSSSQGTVILPVIDTANKYYIFSVTCWEQKRYTPSYDGRLFYTVVDMSLHNNRGDIPSYGKWMQLDTGLAEMIIAVPGNNNNIWIITHANYANHFRVWELTSSGISSTPQVYAVGVSGYKPYVANNTPMIYHNSWWSFGQMAIAPNRKKLAVGYARANYAELYDFDPCTGSISNPLVIDSIRQAGAGSYFTHSGLAFSPNSNLLYVSGIMEDFALIIGRFLYQFDISSGDRATIAASKTRLGRSENTKVRLAPNRKIYSVNSDSPLSSHLDAIQFPDLPGPTCQFTTRAITLDGETDIGIGNDFVKPLSAPADTIWHARIDTTLCHFPESGIPISAPHGYAFYRWHDSSTVPERHISEPGTYYVFYGDNCDFYADSFRFTGASLPDFRIDGPDSVLCLADSVLLTIPVDSVDYLWENGDSSPTRIVTRSGRYIATISKDVCTVSDTIDIRFARWEKNEITHYKFCQNEQIDLQLFSGSDGSDGTEILWNDGTHSLYKSIYDTGTYSVTVRDGNCVFTDTFRISREVCDCAYAVPTAFTPNGDGKNDLFRVLLPADCPIPDFMLRIYDRWGTLVFHTADPSKGWDGSYNGALAEAGTYMYHMQITSGTRNVEVSKKGDLILLR